LSLWLSAVASNWHAMTHTWWGCSAQKADCIPGDEVSLFLGSLARSRHSYTLAVAVRQSSSSAI
jgi:hypothetical protein